MTLDEIKARWLTPPGGRAHWGDVSEAQEADVRWLIERVERLERGIKEIANFVCICHELHPDQYGCTTCSMAEQIVSAKEAQC